MNRRRSFEKQIDSVPTYQYYYSSQSSPSITDSSSFHSDSSRKNHSSTPSTPPPQQISPLTLENLLKVELADPASMPLARYCSEMEAAPFHPAYSESTISVTRKSQHRRQQQDKVLESPRILPFPYHNDSSFLPTAEHDYPGGCSTTDASSSMVSFSIRTMGSRQQLISPPSSYHPNRGYQRQILSSRSTPQHDYYRPRRYDDDDTMSSWSHKRRAASVTPSSPSTLRDEAIMMVPQKKRRNNNSKFASRFKRNLLRFKSNNSTILESRSPQPSITTNSTNKTCSSFGHTFNGPDQCNESPSSSWYEKLWKFLRPQPSVKKSPSSKSASTPVWYSQFRCNPPPPSGINLLS